MPAINFAALARLLLGLAIIASLAACEERYADVVSDACIRDGQPLKFCECTAKRMKDELGTDGYAIFSDMIILSEDATPETSELMAIMERHGLDPDLLASVRKAIEHAAKKVHAFCR